MSVPSSWGHEEWKEGGRLNERQGDKKMTGPQDPANIINSKQDKGKKVSVIERIWGWWTLKGKGPWFRKETRSLTTFDANTRRHTSITRMKSFNAGLRSRTWITGEPLAGWVVGRNGVKWDCKGVYFDSWREATNVGHVVAKYNFGRMRDITTGPLVKVFLQSDWSFGGSSSQNDPSLLPKRESLASNSHISLFDNVHDCDTRRGWYWQDNCCRVSITSQKGRKKRLMMVMQWVSWLFGLYVVLNDDCRCCGLSSSNTRTVHKMWRLKEKKKKKRVKSWDRCCSNTKVLSLCFVQSKEGQWEEDGESLSLSLSRFFSSPEGKWEESVIPEKVFFSTFGRSRMNEWMNEWMLCFRSRDCLFPLLTSSRFFFFARARDACSDFLLQLLVWEETVETSERNEGAARN